MKIPRFYFVILLVLASLSLSACTGAISASSWPGLSADQSMAYVAYQTEVRAVRIDNGTQVWQYPEKGDASKPFYAAPTLTPDGKQLIIGDYDHTLYSLNPQSNGPVGQVNWTFADAKGRWIASALVAGDTILAPNADGNLYALDLQGKLKWTFSARDALWARPALIQSTIYLPGMDHHLYALDVTSGRQIWATDLGGALLDTPAVGQSNMLYIGTLGKELLAVDAVSGKVVWRTALANGVWASPALGKDGLYVGDLSGNFYALNPADGKILWQNKPDGPITATALVTDQQVIVGTEVGSLIAYDPGGKVLWNQKINGTLYTSPVLLGDKVLVALNQADQLLVAVSLTGAQVWAFTPPK